MTKKRISVDFNHYTTAFVDDPYTIYEELREKCPVAHTEHHGGFWILSRYADVKQALLDWETFSSSTPGTVAIPNTKREDADPLLPIESDPPAHTQYRSNIALRFSRKNVDLYQDEIRTLAHSIIDTFSERGHCDIVTDYAEPLFSRTLAIFLKLPQDDTILWQQWADAIFAGRLVDPDAALQARRDMTDYVQQLLDERRRQPRDDIFSALLTLTLDGKPLTQQETRGYALEILLAGREATIDGIANSLWYLAQHPQARQRLLDEPAMMRAAVEEFLRYMSPIQLLGRIATRAVTIHGADINKSEAVAMTFASANHDEQQFPNADQCILDRTPNAHLAFGAGPHTCIGAHLARLGLHVGIETFINRMPDYHLSQSQLAQRKPNGDTRGFQMLPVTFATRT